MILLSIMAVLGLARLNVILVPGIVPSANRSRVIRSATLAVKENQSVEAALSFLGFGGPPPCSSWGQI